PRARLGGATFAGASACSSVPQSTGLSPGGRGVGSRHAGFLVEVGDSYPRAQLARALATATAHRDAEQRARGGTGVSRWLAVIDGMASGSLKIGSRAPVTELPAWVTPEVVRGGFATGAPAAAGHTRLDLSESDLAWLEARLQDGGYRVALPEH